MVMPASPAAKTVESLHTEIRLKRQQRQKLMDRLARCERTIPESSFDCKAVPQPVRDTYSRVVDELHREIAELESELHRLSGVAPVRKPAGHHRSQSEKSSHPKPRAPDGDPPASRRPRAGEGEKDRVGRRARALDQVAMHGDPACFDCEVPCDKDSPCKGRSGSLEVTPDSVASVPTTAGTSVECSPKRAHTAARPPGISLCGGCPVADNGTPSNKEHHFAGVTCAADASPVSQNRRVNSSAARSGRRTETEKVDGADQGGSPASERRTVKSIGKTSRTTTTERIGRGSSGGRSVPRPNATQTSTRGTTRRLPQVGQAHRGETPTRGGRVTASLVVGRVPCSRDVGDTSRYWDTAGSRAARALRADMRKAQR